MTVQAIDIIKASGETARFSEDKLRTSLKRTGADAATINHIIEKVRAELYQGISTKEIYNRAFALLKKQRGHLASKYKLKKAIYELGPTGFPFERFISAVLRASGFQTEVNKILQGKCVTHEIDVMAHKDHSTTIIECKFHSEQGLKCNVKVPLYIHSRYLDIKNHWTSKNTLAQGWVVTNTKFTKDALDYGQCSGLYLLSWNHPKDHSLKDRIDQWQLYPITVSTLLTKREKQFLLERDIVLCRELLKSPFYLDHLGVSNIRKERILSEIKQLCHQ
ncbi:restriction endonuclease [Psychroserpens sp. BH13MA-6]